MIEQTIEDLPIIINIPNSTVNPSTLFSGAGPKEAGGVLLRLLDGNALFDKGIETDVLLLVMCVAVMGPGVARYASISSAAARTGI